MNRESGVVLYRKSARIVDCSVHALCTREASRCAVHTVLVAGSDAADNLTTVTVRQWL